MLGKNADWIRRRWDMRDAIGAARSSVRRRALVVVAVAAVVVVGVSIKRHDEKRERGERGIVMGKRRSPEKLRRLGWRGRQ